MTLSDLSIKRPVFAWMLMVGLMVFGAIGFSRLGVSQLPDVDFPTISVSANLEGAAPEVMETDVADVLEDAMMSIPGVKEISSTSSQGQTRLTIEFELNKDIDLALQDVQTKVAQAQKNLPKELDPPVISKTNPEDQPIMWISLSGDRPFKEMTTYARDVLKDQFTTVEGVGEITLGGYIEPNVRVWVDRAKLSQKELSVVDVITTLQTQHQELPAGRLETPQTESNVRVMGEAQSIDDFENMGIPLRGGSQMWKPIRLGDVATIEDGLNDVRRISRSQFKSSIGFGIRKQRGVNAVQVAEAVTKKMNALQKTLPEGMKMNVVFDTTKFVKESTHELNFTLILSAVLTSVVCWLFMGSWQSALNIVLAIPTSILGTFIFLYFFGFTLNTFTLLGLSLVIGIVVDDAIMVLENIVRHAEMGKSKVKASLEGAREITFAALAASVAILAIFVPVIFMQGIIGKFFFQFGVTISVAVALSLLEALTLAPMRSSQFLQIHHSNVITGAVDRWMDGLKDWYSRILVVCLNNRWKVLGLSLLLFVGSCYSFKWVQKEFVPSQDQSRFLVRLKTPLGSSIAFTDERVKEAEKKVVKLPGVQLYYAAIGGFGGGEVNTAMMFVTLKDMNKRPINPKTGKRYTQKELMGMVRKSFSKIEGIEKVGVQDLSLSGFSAQRGYPVEFNLRGSDWDKLGTLSETLKTQMEKSGVMVDVDSDYLLGVPEVQVIPNREKALAHGVSVSAIGQAVEAMIGGVRVGKYTKNGKRYDIRVQLKQNQRLTPADIQSIWVRNNVGELVSLATVVDIKERPALMSITRKNRERAISVFANVAQGHSQSEALDKVKELTKHLPDGYRVVFSGSAQTYKESFQSLMFALILGLFVAYMVLASQFNSFIHPVTVLLALPFSITGAVGMLLLSHQSLNMYSLIGMLLLMGIVKKNSILLVDFTNVRRKQGLSVKEALLDACPVRLRPIMMTSIATIAAAIPPALAIGPGAETRVPMALVVIGGVTVSTVLTLVVVPCAYSVFSRFENTSHEAELKEALKELGEA